MKEKKQIRAPHVFVLIMIMIICATALTYILPAGTYNRYVDETTGTTLVEEWSYQQIDRLQWILLRCCRRSQMDWWMPQASSPWC